MCHCTLNIFCLLASLRNSHRMNFADLHELLRSNVQSRITDGALTGTRLAQETGFRQGHISNFLNKKRALSLEGLDRVLASQGMTIEDVLPVSSMAAASSVHTDAPIDDPIMMIPLVSASVAGEVAEISSAMVIESLPLATSRLADNHARPSGRSAKWHRFVALRVDAQQAAAMEPTLASGMIAVIDRHYNSIAPYRSHQPTLYAVRYGTGVLLRYVELDDARLILRPSALDCAIQLIVVAEGETPSDYIVGRVCLLHNEL